MAQDHSFSIVVKTIFFRLVLIFALIVFISRYWIAYDFKLVVCVMTFIATIIFINHE